MKKILALLMAGVMCFGILAACGGNEQAATPAPTAAPTAAPTPPPVAEEPADSGWVLSGDNPFDISMTIVTGQTLPTADNRIAQRMRDELGVTIIYELVAGDQQDEKVAILAAGDTLPDILAFSQQEGRLISAGTMLRYDDFLVTGAYPHIYRHLEPVWARAMWRGGGVEDGVYVLPNYNRFYVGPDGTMHGENEPMSMQFAMQKAVMEWHGYPETKGITPEECFRLIIEYMEEFPTIDGMPTIGFTIPMFPGQEWGLTNSPIFANGYPNDGDLVIDPVTGQASMYHTTDYSYRWYKLLNEMYRLGVVDPEFDTQTEDQWLEKLANGRVLGMHHQRWSWGRAIDSLVSEGKYERTTMPLVPVWADSPNPPYYLDNPVMNVQQGWSVSVTTPEPERILTFIDTMLTEYWQIIIQWGEEGIDYIVEPDGTFVCTQEYRDNREDLGWIQSNRLRAFWDQMPKIQGTYPECGQPTDPGRSPTEWQLQLSDYDINFLAAYGKGNWSEFFYRSQGETDPTHYPGWQAPLSDDAREATKQRADWCLERLAGIIKAPSDEAFDELWAEFVEGFDRINIALLEAEVTAFAQQRIAEAASLGR